MKPIFTSLSPNTEKDDIFLALKLIFSPWKWKDRKASQKLEQKIKDYFNIKHAFVFNSGRSSLMAVLKALEIEPGKEILLQAFTCNAAVNPLLDAKLKPVFADIDDTLNIDPLSVKSKINQNTKAIMVQHTFGFPAQVEKILEIAKKNNLFLIEDNAHAFGASINGRLCGTFGDVTFLSFGRDKIISSIFGGAVITNNNEIAEKVEDFQQKINYPSAFWIFQQLLHPLLTNWLIIPFYSLNQYLGRIFLGGFHKLLFLSKSVYKKEKNGEIPFCFPKKMPGVLALLALNQMKKIEKFNEHRQEIADFYIKNLKNPNFKHVFSQSKERNVIFMRYPILSNLNTDDILKKGRLKKIFLNDGWRKSPIVPVDTKLEKMNYIQGSCLKAEKASNTIINLPTHINITKNKAKRIIDFLNNYGN